MKTPARIVVLGGGAIGASTAGLLFDAGAPCVLVARNENGATIAARGVDLRFPATSRRVHVETFSTLAHARVSADDLVVVATMGHHTEAAIAGLDPVIAVASFQNGLAPMEAIARRGHPTLAAMVYVPAERRGPGIIALPAVPSIGTVLVGGWPRGVDVRATWLVEHLARAGFHAEAESDIAPWIRAKLLTNLAGIVVALCDAPPVDVIEAAQEEARAVFRAASEPFVDIAALVERAGPRHLELVDGVARANGSTRAALARGDELETASLHGSIIATGHAVGVATPVNEALVRLAARATSERWRPGSVDPELVRALAT